MKYVYPAIFTPLTEGEFDGGYAVSVPDLPYIHTFGKDLAEAIEMAEDAHVNFSSVLQEALKTHLKIHELKRT